MDEERDKPGVVLVGVGILAGAVALVLYAWLFALAAPSFVDWDTGSGSGPVGVLGATAIVASVPTAVWIMVLRRRRGVDQPRGWLVVPTLVTTGAGVWAVTSWQALVTRGLPGEQLLLILVACCGVPVGCALVFLSARRGLPRLWSVRGGTAFVAGVLVVALGAGAAVVVGGDHTRVEATTAAAIAVPAEPADVSGVRWRWHADSINDTVAAGAGVVATTPGGVVALDGRTGKQRWHYRRTDAEPTWLTALDGGRAVAVDFGGWLHVLDAITGELWWRLPPERTDGRLKEFGAASHALVAGAAGDTLVAAPEPNTVAGFDVRTGEEKWTYSLAKGCWVQDADGTDRAVVLIQICGEVDTPDHATAVAIDTGTGQRLWTRADIFLVNAAGSGMVVGCTADFRQHVVDLRSGRTTAVGRNPCYTRTFLVDLELGQYLTQDGLSGLGDADAVWSIPRDDTTEVLSAVATEDLVAMLSASSALGDRRLWLTLRDRGTGEVRHVFDGNELSASNDGPLGGGANLLVAPGALVVHAIDGADSPRGQVLVGLA